MAERIYTRGEEGKLEPLEEERFSTEDELQALIAEHPDLLDGEQIRPGDPRRWVLVTREKGIAETSDAGTWRLRSQLPLGDMIPMRSSGDCYRWTEHRTLTFSGTTCLRT
jgi:hypothetical protein